MPALVHFHRGSSRVSIFFACLLAWGCLGTAWWSAPDACGQMVPRWNRVQGGVFTNPHSEEPRTATLATPPRELRRELSQAERAIAEGEYFEALEAFDRILQDPTQGDYFLPSSRGDVASPSQRPQSLKGRVYQLLAELPEPARKAYELRYGSAARDLLREAVEQGDRAKLEEVSRRYFHSEAGQEATYLLARLSLELGQARTALWTLQRLGKASPKYVEKADWLSVLAYLIEGDEAAARQKLKQLQERTSREGPHIDGQAFDISLDTEGLWNRLRAMAHSQMTESGAFVESWANVDGGLGRQRQAHGGMPLPQMQWMVPATTVEEEAQTIDGIHRRLLDQDLPAIPVVRPILGGGFVFVRTPRMGLGIRVDQGKRVWCYPAHDMQEAPPTLDPRLFRGLPRLEGTHPRIQQQIFEDNIFGQVSVDDRCLYLVSQLEQVGVATDELMARRFQLGMEEAYPLSTNRLSAVEHVTEGKTLWMVGGEDSEEPRLAQAFFLGPPLRVGDSLYAIVELKDELRLVVLDPARGTLRWSQVLAEIEPPNYVAWNPNRRLGGAVPSFQDGILVCPTSSGLVIALDLATRTLRWSYTYARKGERLANFEINPWGLPAVGVAPWGHRWLDSAAVIAQGSVLLTPLESDQLYCLDLATGEERWAPRPREEGLFIGGIHENVVAVVERSKIRSHRLEDGKPAWPDIEFSEHQVPSGRGFVVDKYLYLPTSNRELLRIDLEQGTIAERISTEHVLGNLMVAGDYMISQAPDAIRAFLIRDRIRDQLVRQMQERPDDPAVLNSYANLLLGDGKVREALDILEKALQLEHDSNARQAMQSLLVDTSLQALRRDFAGNRFLLERLRGLPAVQEHEREILRLEAEGYAKLNHPDLALRALLQLARPPSSDVTTRNQERPLQFHPQDADIRLSEQLWVAIQLQSLWQGLEESQRAELQADIEGALRWARDKGSSADLHWLLRTFSPSLTLPDWRRELIDRWTQQPNVLAAQLGLSQWIQEAPPEDALRARLLLADLLARHDRPWAALRELELATSEHDPQGVSGSEFAQKRQTMQSEVTSAAWSWPDAPLRARNSPRIHLAMNFHGTIPIDIEDVQGPADEGMFAVLEEGQPRQLTLLDHYGRTRCRIPISIGEQWLQGGLSSLSAKIYGDLIIFSLGNKLLAVSTVGENPGDPARVLWQKDLRDVSTGSLSRQSAPAYHVQQRTNPFLANQSLIRIVSRPDMMMSNLGPVQAHAVCHLAPDGLECLSPVTGELLWRRRNVSSSNPLFGDDQYVYLSQDDNVTLIPYALADGTRARPRRMPSTEKHWCYRGRYILAFDRKSSLLNWNQQLLSLWDPWREEKVWERRFPNGTMGCLVEHDEVAIIRPNGLLEVLSLRNGETRFKYTFTLNLPVTSLDVIRSHDRYLVLVGLNDDGNLQDLQRRGISLRGPVMGNRFRSFTGPIMSFHRDKGEPQWSRPVQVQQFYLPSFQPSELPCLPLYRSVQQRVLRAEELRGPTRTLVSNSELVLIDLRTGALALQVANPPAIWRSMVLRGDPRTDSLELVTEQGTILGLEFGPPHEQTGAAEPAVLSGVSVPQEDPPPTRPEQPEE